MFGRLNKSETEQKVISGNMYLLTISNFGIKYQKGGWYTEQMTYKPKY